MTDYYPSLIPWFRERVLKAKAEFEKSLTEEQKRLYEQWQSAQDCVDYQEILGKKARKEKE